MDDNFLLHVTARGKFKNDVRKILDKALELGITSVFALRGGTAVKIPELFFIFIYLFIIL